MDEEVTTPVEETVTTPVEETVTEEVVNDADQDDSTLTEPVLEVSEELVEGQVVEFYMGKRIVNRSGEVSAAGELCELEDGTTAHVPVEEK